MSVRSLAMVRGRRIIDDSSDDEFPDLQDIGSFKVRSPNKVSIGTPMTQKRQASSGDGTVRRRKLGVIADNPLLRPFGDRSSSMSTPNKDEVPRKKKSVTPQRVELRTRKTKPVTTSVEVKDPALSEADSVQEETILEDFSEDEDAGSDFEASHSEESDGYDSTADLFLSRSPSKSKRVETEVKGRKVSGAREKNRSPSPSAQLLAEAIEAQERSNFRESSGGKNTKTRNKASFRRAGEGSREPSVTDIAEPLSKLQIYELPPPTKSKRPSDDNERPTTPTSPLPEPKVKGLVSPSKKLDRIPATPHHPQTDTFWNQEFIDEWNDEHSPKKQLFLPNTTTTTTTTKPQNPTKKQGAGGPSKKGSEAAAQKAAKKAFTQLKHEVADKFLKELDERIADRKISDLASATGGIRIEWTNKLNTTAGRANWKRETIKSKSMDGETSSTTRFRHHASIELAEKVIDDEHRLLNVIAHEFCHLANFMISGVTTNPHGREFKMWAAKVTAAFADRGIEVTTKHSYDIDFKYVWECAECLIEYKRHSKSIHPERHRCGACKGQLKQTKPVPRAKPSKESEYQRFMKEQMKVLKEENPTIPQKDIMKMVASRWAEREKVDKRDNLPGPAASTRIKDSKVEEGVSKAMDNLAIIDLTL